MVFSKLSHLVDRSLVAAHTDGDRTRYHLLEVVRQYAHQALVRSGEESIVQARHASFFVTFAEEAERGLDGPDQISWLARVARDHDNLRAALAWSLAQDSRSEIGLRLAGSLIAFWFIRGHLDEGERWLEQLVARAATGPSEPKAKALIGAALLAAFQERYQTAEQLATEGLELFRELDNTEGVAVAINALGTIAFAGQHTAVSLPDLLKEGRALRPRLTNRRLIAQTLDLEAASRWAPGTRIGPRSCGNRVSTFPGRPATHWGRRSPCPTSDCWPPHEVIRSARPICCGRVYNSARNSTTS